MAKTAKSQEKNGSTSPRTKDLGIKSDETLATAGISDGPSTGPEVAEKKDSPKRGGKQGRGPKAGRGALRDTILASARTAFISQGYDATTMRGIAREANCDSALVSYYFGSKQLLFRECMNLPSDPAQMVLSTLMEGREGAGERLVRTGFQLYEEQFTKDTMTALMRALMANVSTSQRFKHYVRTDVIDRVASFSRRPDLLAEEIEITMSTMYGIATMRYIVGLEPLASMPRERLIRQIAPTIQVRIDRIFTLFEM
ncbi:MAG: TetR/AcrR family transcriptional regulator [Ancrocorticia sp.]|uniref:TetR/AcrR family transcriptional regulator n=1 Tax=Ancrocorticia sp. TaxID=2593684 RepID=UPI003F8F0303